MRARALGLRQAGLPEAVGQRTGGDRQLGDVAGRQSCPCAAAQGSRAGYRRRDEGHWRQGGELARRLRESGTQVSQAADSLTSKSAGLGMIWSVLRQVDNTLAQ